MIKIPIEDIVEKIKEKTGLSADEINGKIKERTDKLAGLISKEGAAHIVANELGVKLFDPAGGSQKIKNILPGMRSVETQGRVVRKFDINEFNTGERQGKVGSFIMGDETGQIRVTCWNDQCDLLNEIQENSVVKIVDGYVKENRGNKEIHLNTKSRLVINPENVTVGEIAPPQQSQRKNIKDLTEADSDVEILATVVQVYEIRFFEACPECKKRVKMQAEQFACPQHGVVTPSYSYVLNAFLDDGTGNIRGVFFTNQLQRLLKKEDEEIQIFRTSPEKFEDVKTDLLGEMVRLTGRVTKNDMFDRLEFMSRTVSRDVDPEEEIKRLQAEQPAESVAPTEPVQPVQPAGQEAVESPKPKAENVPSIQELAEKMDSVKPAESSAESSAEPTVDASTEPVVEPTVEAAESTTESTTDPLEESTLESVKAESEGSSVPTESIGVDEIPISENDVGEQVSSEPVSAPEPQPESASEPPSESPSETATEEKIEEESEDELEEPIPEDPLKQEEESSDPEKKGF